MRLSRVLWILDAAAIIVLGALAFVLTFKAGMRGFFPFDQSIVFDGSYRVLSGQVPYRDFVMPFGPMTFWLHAISFRLLGVTYFAYVFGSATINVLAVFTSIVMVRIFLPPGRLVSYAAAALTAVWFYPPFGTPWVDQTAFFFSMLAITALAAATVAGQGGKLRRDVLAGASGVLALLAFLSKQNAGAFMLPIYPLVAIVACLPDYRTGLRRLAAFAVGLGASIAGFAVWLVAASSSTNFMRYVIRLSSELGQRRLRTFVRNWLGIARPFFGGRGPISVRVVIIASVVVALAALVIGLRRLGRKQAVSPRLLAASLTCVYLALFQHVFINTTFNQPENSFAFLGVILAIGAGLLVELPEASWLSIRRLARGAHWRPALVSVVAVAVVLAVAVASAVGVKVSMARVVMDILRYPMFAEPFQQAGLKGLQWGEPTRMGGYSIEGKDVADLLTYLRGQHQNFFVFPDFTIMYGLAGVPSPQPLLWFHEGVTYPKRVYDAALDQWVVSDLKRNNVRIVVIEQVAWFNTGPRIDAFPLMKAYIYGNFVRLGQIGTFAIYQKPPGSN
ncbi:MAG TPA: hypothetical protein VMU02_00050 [bacterium]|nr:hypothetical protein [bacterium]